MSTRARPPVAVIVAGTGSPGGTDTVIVCSTDRGSAARFSRTTSIQTIPMPEGGTHRGRLRGGASSDVAASSDAPVYVSIARCRAASRTVTAVTVTGIGKPLTSCNS